MKITERIEEAMRLNKGASRTIEVLVTYEVHE